MGCMRLQNEQASLMVVMVCMHSEGSCRQQRGTCTKICSICAQDNDLYARTP